MTTSLLTSKFLTSVLFHLSQTLNQLPQQLCALIPFVVTTFDCVPLSLCSEAHGIQIPCKPVHVIVTDTTISCKENNPQKHEFYTVFHDEKALLLCGNLYIGTEESDTEKHVPRGPTSSAAVGPFSVELPDFVNCTQQLRDELSAYEGDPWNHYFDSRHYTCQNQCNFHNAIPILSQYHGGIHYMYSQTQVPLDDEGDKESSWKNV